MRQAETIASHPLRFRGEDFAARASGALWWPARGTLIVADLHLGRSERYARRGGPLLPPWEVADTLDRLEAEIAALDPARIVSLGDGFDDSLAVAGLAPEARNRLWHLAGGRDWLWIAGNHDPLPAGPGLPGRAMAELPDEISLRHQAGSSPDISGHMHPAVRLAGRSWRCFALGRAHLILPAFGSYTGGLQVGDPAFAPLVGGGIAICCSSRMFTVPIPDAGQAQASRSGPSRW